MPDFLILAMMIISLFIIFVFFNEEEPFAGTVCFGFLIISILWFSLAHVECGSKIKSQKVSDIYNIQTISGTVQAALIDDELFNITEHFNKIVDAGKCQIKMTTYNNMNYGMWCSFCSQRLYELECQQ